MVLTKTSGVTLRTSVMEGEEAMGRGRKKWNEMERDERWETRERDGEKGRKGKARAEERRGGR